MAGPEEPTEPAPQRSEQGSTPPRRRRRRRKPKAGGQAKAATAKAAQPAPAPGAAAKPRSASGRKRSRQKKKGSGAKKKGAQRGPKIPTTKEVSAGGVVYRRGADGIEIVETREQAAVREVREETGLTADIEADLGDTKYMYVWDDIRIRKTVHFFLMRHTGGDVEDRDDEMEEIRWFPLERAIKRAAYRGERDMLVKASELLA